jgi:chromate transporter
MLLVAGTLPFWDTFRRWPMAQAAMRGTNAAVVGVLGSALYNPVWIGAVLVPMDFAIVAIGFALLTVWKLPPLAVVVAMTAAAVAVAALR